MKIAFNTELLMTNDGQSALKSDIRLKAGILSSFGNDVSIVNGKFNEVIDEYDFTFDFHYFDRERYDDIGADKTLYSSVFPEFHHPPPEEWKIGNICKSRIDNFVLFDKGVRSFIINRDSTVPNNDYIIQKRINGIPITAAIGKDFYWSRDNSEEIRAAMDLIWSRMNFENRTPLIRCDFIRESLTGNLYFLDINYRPYIGTILTPHDRENQWGKLAMSLVENNLLTGKNHNFLFQ